MVPRFNIRVISQYIQISNHYVAPETNIILYVNYTSIKKKMYKQNINIRKDIRNLKRNHKEILELKVQ